MNYNFLSRNDKILYWIMISAKIFACLLALLIYRRFV
nr:MAG TPA: hypothetical protein [Caudoviricetes sp.]